MALIQPVSVTDVRLIKINFVIDAGDSVMRNVTTSVMLRNLKDNL